MCVLLMQLIVDNVCKCALVYRSMTSWAMRLIGRREFVNPRHDGCHPWLREYLALYLDKYIGKVSQYIIYAYWTFVWFSFFILGGIKKLVKEQKYNEFKELWFPVRDRAFIGVLSPLRTSKMIQKYRKRNDKATKIIKKRERETDLKNFVFKNFWKFWQVQKFKIWRELRFHN